MIEKRTSYSGEQSVDDLLRIFSDEEYGNYPATSKTIGRMKPPNGKKTMKYLITTPLYVPLAA